MQGGPYKLVNGVQEYAWGSRTFIPELLGRPTPAPAPQAELWMGAHPASPSRILVNGALEPLDRLIQRDPRAILGRRVAEAFGGRLPFLMKVLAADRPLSIQAHPNAEQARRGWARDNEKGLAPDSPDRSYRDASHKPEIMAPLTDLWAIHGFRAPAEALELLRELALPALGWMAATLEHGGPVALLEALLTLGSVERAAMVRDAAEAAPKRLGEPVGAWIARLEHAYPGDAGVLSPLFLNLVKVPPGSAVYLGPGELHAYLRGAGVELMANSDNVLRGGLTPKKVDVAELVAILDTRADARPPMPPRDLGTGESVWPTPAAEFRLSRIQVRGSGVFRRPAGDAVSPEIHVVIQGSARLCTPDRDALALGRGESCLLTAETRTWTLEGDAVVYRARVP